MMLFHFQKCTVLFLHDLKSGFKHLKVTDICMELDLYLLGDLYLLLITFYRYFDAMKKQKSWIMISTLASECSQTADVTALNFKNNMCFKANAANDEA